MMAGPSLPGQDTARGADGRVLPSLRRLKPACIIILCCLLLHVFMLGARRAIAGPFFALEMQRAVVFSFPWFVLSSYLPQLVPLVVLLCCMRARPPRRGYTVTWGKFATMEAHINFTTPVTKQYPVDVTHARLRQIKLEDSRAVEGYAGQGPGVRAAAPNALDAAALAVGGLTEVDLVDEHPASIGGAALVDVRAVPFDDEARSTQHRTPHDNEAELSFL
jgi:hypothetical protein